MEVAQFNMGITKRQLARCTESLLQGLRNNGISSLEAALNMVGKKLDVAGAEYPAIIHIRKHDLDLGKTTLQIEYEEKIHYGTPIELSINPELDYRFILVRCAEPIEGYVQRWGDRSGNILQVKKGKGVKWIEAIKDLEDLSKLK